MASKFSSTKDICEAYDCEAITTLTYYVKVKKKLCDVCAYKQGCNSKARKGGPNLHCEKHDEDIDLYCKTHGEALCLACASNDHNHQPCVRQDIEDAIVENKAKLNGLKEKAMDNLKLFQAYGDQILKCRQATDKHLQAIKREVDSVINEAIKTDKEREQEDAAKIKQEFGAKNQKLKMYEKERKLEQNHTNAKKRQVSINNKQRDLQDDIEDIARVTEKKIVESEKSWKDYTKTAENTVQTLTTALTDDRSIAKDGHRVNTSVTEELKKPLDKDGVKRITRSVSGVRFVEGAGREKYNGRIDGYGGEWKLIDTIYVKDKFTFPAVVGCIGENEVMIIDFNQANPLTYMYMLDMTTKITKRVITVGETSFVRSCTLLNDGKVVCSKLGKDLPRNMFTGCIHVYDRQRNLINDVTIPRNMEGKFPWVHVAAGKDGMIIAAESAQTEIYIINPPDSKIIDTITCKMDMRMRGMLSSGHIIAQPYPLLDKVLIINRKGAHREIPLGDEFAITCIDPLTDDIYGVTPYDECKRCVIGQVMIGGHVNKRARVFSFPLSTRLTDEGDRAAFIGLSRVMITPSGKVIASDGANILVFKRLFSL